MMQRINGLLGRNRRARERRTVRCMIRLFCRERHRPAAPLCAACDALWAYAQVRLDRCRFGEAKPTCASCPVHCYQRQQRERIREVMRVAGPKMLWRHPALALLHLLDGRRAPAL